MADETIKVKVWRRFERINKNGHVTKFRIQHMPEDKMDELIQYMCTNYIREENLISTAGVPNDPVALKEIEKFFISLPEKTMSLICCLDNEVKPEEVTRNDIVAASMLYLSIKDSNPPFEIPKSEPGIKLYAFYLDTSSNETIYGLYKIDRYLTGAGLSVLPEYRGLGLGVELTLVRDEVCRAAGLKVTASYYTGIKSQNLASKCGYKTYYERDFAEIGEIMDIKFPDHTKKFKKMAKIVN